MARAIARPLRLSRPWEFHGSSRRRIMKRSSCRLTRLVLTAFAPLALVLLTTGDLFADNNAYSFEGQYTAPSCGPAFDFTIGAGTRTIDVVASTIPANDIVLKLYHNGLLIAQQDTATSPEAIHYATGAELETGKYSAVVCPFNGEAVLTPADYAGIVTVSELPLPPLTIIPPGSTTNAPTVFPIPSFQAWNARFTPAAVVDSQRTEGEPLVKIGASVSNDNGNTWRKNPAAVQQTVVDRQWYAVDNGATSGAFDNTIFLAFHTTAVGTFIYSSPGSQGGNDPTGGLFFQNSATMPGPLQPLAADAICAQLRFDKVKRNLYYACNE